MLLPTFALVDDDEQGPPYVMVPALVDLKVYSGVESLVGVEIAFTCSIDGAVASVVPVPPPVPVPGTCIRVMPKLRLLVFMPMEKGCDSP